MKIADWFVLVWFSAMAVSIAFAVAMLLEG
jgi:uncharacterized membrane protein